MRTPSRGRLPGLLFALSVAAACNLSELSKVTFDLPPKTYSFNTSSWSLPPVPPAAIPCADATTCCIPGVIDCAAATPATILCAEGVCAVDIPITVPQRVILGRESPTLSNVTGVVNITIERIGYDVLNNTLNIDLPQLDLYLAPDGVMDISDPSVRKFGTVPPIPAGTTVAGGDVQLDPDAARNFAMFTSNLRTPFNFIAHGIVRYASGAPVPNGALDIKITGTMSASL